MTGFRLVPGRPPLYSLVLRLLLWLLPLLLALLPAILPPPIGPSLAAALTLAFTFTLRLVSRVIIGQKASVGGGEGEEEELVWDGVLGPTTWTILTPPRHPLAGFFLQVQEISILHYLCYIDEEGYIADNCMHLCITQIPGEYRINCISLLILSSFDSS